MKSLDRVRMDWVAREVRNTVDPEFIGSDTVFHYSIPVIDETGDGRLEPIEDLGSSKTVLVGGEVLISKLNPRKARVLIAERHDVPTVCSGEFVVLQPRDVERRYLYWLLLSEATRQELHSHVQSVTRSQQRARPDDISKMWIQVPSRKAQRAIADYIDEETARIDNVILAKRAQVQLLLARTESLVAARLDPLVRTLGEVPLKSVAELRFSNVDKKSYDGEKAVLLCNYTDVYYNRRIDGRITFMEATASPSQVAQLTLRAGDVLLTKDSESAEDIAVAALVTVDLPASCSAITWHSSARASWTGHSCTGLFRAVASGMRSPWRLRVSLGLACGKTPWGGSRSPTSMRGPRHRSSLR
jgi:hypothetical protein